MKADEELHELGPYFPRESEGAAGQCVVHVLATGPGGQPDAIHSAMLAMLFGAQRDHHDHALLRARRGDEGGADQRGVAGRGRDAGAARRARRQAGGGGGAVSLRRPHQRLGVRIVLHPHGLLHAKTATIDRRLAMVGSANFDMRSFWLNFECTLFMYDEGFARELRFMQKHYKEQGGALPPPGVEDRPLRSRFIDQCPQLLSPLL